MSNAAIAAGGAAAAAAIANAIKASGVLVRLAPDDFRTLLQKAQNPLVVFAEGGFLRTHYQYLFSYKGLAFYTKSRTPLNLPGEAETVLAKGIWMPV